MTKGKTTIIGILGIIIIVIIAGVWASGLLKFEEEPSEEEPEEEKNNPPTILTQDINISTVDEFYSINYNCTDPDGDTIIWTLGGNASWLTIDSNGWLNGTPSKLRVGNFNVWINVSDGKGGTDSHYFILKVNAPTKLNIPPVPEIPEIPEGTPHGWIRKLPLINLFDLLFLLIMKL